MTDDKPPMPANLRPLAADAMLRHQERTVPPKIAVEGGTETGLRFSSPYREEDQEAWEALLFQAFGTRSIPVAQAFLTHLSKLCAKSYDGETKQWRPDQDELDAILAIINSLEPRNEAEAALAANAVAVHLAAMKLGRNIAAMQWPEDRTVATLTRAVRCYGDQLMTLAKLKGHRTTHQTFEVHHHDHRHIHQGGANFGGRADGTDGAGLQKLQRAGEPSGCAALPGPTEARSRPLSIASGEGQAGLPDTWRRPRIRRGEGTGERLLSTRGVDA